MAVDQGNAYVNPYQKATPVANNMDDGNDPIQQEVFRCLLSFPDSQPGNRCNQKVGGCKWSFEGPVPSFLFHASNFQERIIEYLVEAGHDANDVSEVRILFSYSS